MLPACCTWLLLPGFAGCCGVSVEDTMWLLSLKKKNKGDRRMGWRAAVYLAAAITVEQLRSGCIYRAGV